MSPVRIGVVGLGKIAVDQHLPAIAANPRFDLVATVNRSGAPSATNFTSSEEMLRNAEHLDAVAITTPPGPRYAIARDSIKAGLHVLLEKPPTATLAEIDELDKLARTHGVSLFTTWHAQHNPAVLAAARLLKDQRIRSMEIIWHEDVEKWHPGQKWIWQAGGFGVFDPGINAFSIASLIFPSRLIVASAELYFPEAASTPIAAEIGFTSEASDGALHCSLDWRRESGEQWSIALETEAGTKVELTEGGSHLQVDGVARPAEGPGEYPDIYRRFAELIDGRASQVDVEPLRLVADCFLVAGRRTVGNEKVSV